MILRNLLRRKGRTLLTVLGIAIGVASIVALGALAQGLDEGYTSVLNSSQADLVLSDPDAMDITLSAVDEEIGGQLEVMPEISAVSGMLQGIVQTGENPYFFVFGYPEDSFMLGRFQVIRGIDLYSHDADQMRGTPILLGSAASEALNKDVGDIVEFTRTSYRIVGIYQTGDAFEEGGAVMRLEDAQTLLGLQRQVSLYYIQVERGADINRLRQRAERLWPDLALTTGDDLADRQLMGESMQGMVWAIAGISILIGGVGMMNAQLMSVFERTREIGVLRAVGWSSGRVLRMILGESLMVGLLGGALGIGMGWGSLAASGAALSAFGTSAESVGPGLLLQALVVVLVLGFTGGAYPAWRAARLEPVEALRYEGGSGGEARSRLPIGGMAVQSLWRRKLRTLLTVGGIAITVGSVMSLDSQTQGMMELMNGMMGGAEIVIRQAEASDLGYAFLDQRIGDKLAAIPGIRNVSGMVFTAVAYPDTAFFMIMGYAPREAAITRFNVVEGRPIDRNHEIMLGRRIAEMTNLGIGDNITVADSRFRIVGIYESGVAWEELGGVMTVRDAQGFTGKPGKVTLFMIDLDDPAAARQMVQEINSEFPEVHAALGGEFADNLEEMKNTELALSGISIMAIVVGGVGMMNTMLMAVLERTREIGVLRALGWRRRKILSLIINEALVLGILGGAAGIAIAFGLNYVMRFVPFMDVLQPIWSAQVFIRAIAVALLLGLIGGIYPALRATRLQPVEALRYE